MDRYFIRDFCIFLSYFTAFQWGMYIERSYGDEEFPFYEPPQYETIPPVPPPPVPPPPVPPLPIPTTLVWGDAGYPFRARCNFHADGSRASLHASDPYTTSGPPPHPLCELIKGGIKAMYEDDPSAFMLLSRKEIRGKLTATGGLEETFLDAFKQDIAFWLKEYAH